MFAVPTHTCIYTHIICQDFVITLCSNGHHLFFLKYGSFILLNIRILYSVVNSKAASAQTQSSAISFVSVS